MSHMHYRSRHHHSPQLKAAMSTRHQTGLVSGGLALAGPRLAEVLAALLVLGLIGLPIMGTYQVAHYFYRHMHPVPVTAPVTVRPYPSSVPEDPASEGAYNYGQYTGRIYNEYGFQQGGATGALCGRKYDTKPALLAICLDGLRTTVRH